MEKRYCPYCMNPVETGQPCQTCGLTSGTYIPSPHHLPPGTILKERYLVGRVLGEGGFGITYIGHDLQLELKVAIKEYFPIERANRIASVSLSVSAHSGTAGTNYENDKARFLQEARTMAKMDKQRVIVSVRDFFELNNTAYIVMEYIEGITFKEFITRRKKGIPSKNLLRVMEPLFFALEEMHNLGLVHRDISPENLMIENGEVRLLDFGCARESGNGNATLTIALKHGYAPVEQYQNKGQGPWSDVYSLSATIYYCLTGRKPPQSMDRLAADELIPPRKLGSDLTEWQEKALLYGMGIRPRRRFQSVMELYAALYKKNVQNETKQDELKTKPKDDTPNESETKPKDDTPNKPETKPKDDTPNEPETKPKDDTPNEPEAEPKDQAPNESEYESMELTEETRPSNPPEEKAELSTDTKNTSWLFKHRKAIVISGIAVLVLIAALILAWHPWSSNSPDNENNENTDNQQTDDWSNAVTLNQGSGKEFLALLLDDTISSIILTDCFFQISEPVEIKKPVYITGNSTLDFVGTVTVNGAYLLLDKSAVSIESYLRTVNGSRVSVASSGFLTLDLLWAEQADDISITEDGIICLQNNNFTKSSLKEIENQLLILSENELFTHASHVTTIKEYQMALQQGNPIIIDANMPLSKSLQPQTVPILINKGVTVTASGNAWCEENAILINYGTLKGNFSYEYPGTICMINYGKIEAELNLSSGSKLFNFGTIQMPQGNFLWMNIINMGDIFVTAENSLDIQEEESGNNSYCLNITGGIFNNYSTITVQNTEFLKQEPAVLRLCTGGLFRNRGNIYIGAHGRLENTKYLDNRGTIYCTDKTGGLWNYGLLSNSAHSGKIDLSNSNSILSSNFGIIQYDKNDNTAPYFPVSFHNSGREFAFNWESIPEDYYFVRSPEELRQAAIDKNCKGIIVWNDVTLESELTITKGLAVPADVTLTVNGLTLRGEDAFLYCDNRLDLKGGILKIEDSVAVLQNKLINCNGITIISNTNVGTLYACQADLNDAASIKLDGGHFIGQQMSFNGTDIQIQNEGMLCSCEWLNLFDCTVNISENSSLLLNTINNFFMDETTTLTNHGAFKIIGNDWQNKRLMGKTNNYGIFRLAGGEELGGNFSNYGTLLLNGISNVTGIFNNIGNVSGANNHNRLNARNNGQIIDWLKE